MIATLRFSLPDEEPDFRAATEAMRYRLLLHDVAETLRSRTKYGHPADVDTPEAAYEELRRAFYDLCDQNDIDLDW